MNMCPLRKLGSHLVNVILFMILTIATFQIWSNWTSWGRISAAAVPSVSASIKDHDEFLSATSHSASSATRVRPDALMGSLGSRSVMASLRLSARLESCVKSLVMEA